MVFPLFCLLYAVPLTFTCTSNVSTVEPVIKTTCIKRLSFQTHRRVHFLCNLPVLIDHQRPLFCPLSGLLRQVLLHLQPLAKWIFTACTLYGKTHLFFFISCSYPSLSYNIHVMYHCSIMLYFFITAQIAQGARSIWIALAGSFWTHKLSLSFSLSSSLSNISSISHWISCCTLVPAFSLWYHLLRSTLAFSTTE